MRPSYFTRDLLVALANLAWSAPLLAQVAQAQDQDRAVATPSSRLDRLATIRGDGPETTITGRPGEGFKISAGDAYSLAVLSWLQPQYRFLARDALNPASNGAGTDTSSFGLRAARTRFSGNLFDKDIEYRLSSEWTENNAVKDAWLRWTFWRSERDAIALRFGQQKPLYGRESTAEDWKLDFVDRALATRSFASSRSRGVMLLGEHLEGKLHWSAAAFESDVAAASSNAGEEAANPDNELDYVFSIRLDPRGDMGDESYSEGDLDHTQDLLWSVGAALQLGNHRTTLGGATVDADGRDINMHGALKYQGLHVLGEVFLRSDDPDVPGARSSDSTGWQVGGTYTLARREGKNGQWSFGGRYSRISLDDAAQAVLTATPLGPSKGDVDEITALVGFYYRAHKIKLQGSWTLQEVKPSGSNSATNQILELQFQFLF